MLGCSERLVFRQAVFLDDPAHGTSADVAFGSNCIEVDVAFGNGLVYEHECSFGGPELLARSLDARHRYMIPHCLIPSSS